MSRSDYHERRAARIERYEERVDKARQESGRLYSQAKSMADVIPFGQPILIGHHSEGRDRRYRARFGRMFDRSFQEANKAEHYAERAAAAEANDAISSDNPDAVALMAEKLARAEEAHAQMRAANAAWRKAKGDINAVPEEVRPLIAKAMAARMGYERNQPFQGWALTNSSANIRRMKERLEALKKVAARAEAPARETAFDGGRVVENGEANRLQIFFDAKPDADMRDKLKRHGFRWAPSEGAWQRQLNAAGVYAVRSVLGLPA